jgi:MFS family permease
VIPPLLHDTAFRRFWAGQTVSLLGDQVSLFAVPLTAVLVLHANAAQMGLLTAAGLLPSLLFSLAAGAAIDRHGQRRRIMLMTDVGRSLLMATIPIGYALGRLGLPQLYAVTFAVGTLDVLFFVAYSGLFVSVVPPQRYVQGESLLNGSRAMSFIVGQSGAGLLVVAITAPGAIVVDALTFLVSGLALARIRPAEPSTAEPGHGDLAAGVRFIAGSRTLRSALGATATVNFFAFAFNAIVILYATRALHVHPAVLGLVLGSGAIGGLLGSFVTGRVTRRIGLGPSSSPGASCSRHRWRSSRSRADRTPWCSCACSSPSSAPARA